MRALAIVVALSGCGRVGFDPPALGDAALSLPSGDATATPRCDPRKPFGPLMPLPQLSSSQDEIGLELVDDGLTGFLWSNRTGTDQIYETSRPSLDRPFSAPVLVTPLVTSGAADRDPCPSGDGLSIIFGSQRPGGGG